MELHSLPGLGRIWLQPAWGRAQIAQAVPELLEQLAHRLPQDRAAPVLIKPNLNNDLPALTGNSADLRVLEALLGALGERGHRDITVADGSNIGIERRGIDTFRRLRIDRLAQRHGARCLDLNKDQGLKLRLHGGAEVAVSRRVMEAACLISLPKIKTHAEAGLSCAIKNWMGVVVAQDKREMHRDLGRNLYTLSELLRPHLVLVDGLVGMEGNGPGDGDPAALGCLLGAETALGCDLAVAALTSTPIESVPYLREAQRAGAVPAALEALLQPLRGRLPLRPPPPRTRLNRLSDLRLLLPLKRALRPLTDRPELGRLARRIRLIQDVYQPETDAVTALRRDPARCGDCRRCEDWCPTGLSREQIGQLPAAEACVGCLYCWWVCPSDALSLLGPLGQLQAQAERYGDSVRALGQDLPRFGPAPETAKVGSRS
jgi:uncharacterized protein (DUF362 family)/ferredoxin